MIAVGAECYRCGASPSTGMGVLWDEEELDEALKEEVSSLVFDSQGKDEIRELLAGVVETSFERQQLEQTLNVSAKVENWRVGEGIAEAYLVEHRSCFFPWPDARDERKTGSSLPGADLVGVQKDSRGDHFVFGEVKTSAERKYPPGAVYGRTGLKQQLEDLRDKVGVQNDLFKYLGYRAQNSSWSERFKEACKRYINNQSDIQLFGVLVRDVEPHADDVRARVNKLGEDCPADMQIELLALYLPPGAISGLSSRVSSARREV